VQQLLVLHQAAAEGRGRLAGAGEDALAAPLVVGLHVGRAQGGRVVAGRGQGHGARRELPVAAALAARRQRPEAEGHRRVAQHGDQPADGPGVAQAAVAPGHGLGEAQGPDARRQALGEDRRGVPPGDALAHGQVLALGRLDAVQVRHGHAVPPREALRRLGGRAVLEGGADGRSRQLLLAVLLPELEALHEDGQAPRRREAADGPVVQTLVIQPGGCLRRELLQSREYVADGQLLAADLEQEVLPIHPLRPCRRHPLREAGSPGPRVARRRPAPPRAPGCARA